MNFGFIGLTTAKVQKVFQIIASLTQFFYKMKSH